MRGQLSTHPAVIYRVLETPFSFHDLCAEFGLLDLTPEQWRTGEYPPEFWMRVRVSAVLVGQYRSEGEAWAAAVAENADRRWLETIPIRVAT